MDNGTRTLEEPISEVDEGLLVTDTFGDRHPGRATSAPSFRVARMTVAGS